MGLHHPWWLQKPVADKLAPTQDCWIDFQGCCTLRGNTRRLLPPLPLDTPLCLLALGTNPFGSCESEVRAMQMAPSREGTEPESPGRSRGTSVSAACSVTACGLGPFFTRTLEIHPRPTGKAPFHPPEAGAVTHPPLPEGSLQGHSIKFKRWSYKMPTPIPHPSTAGSPVALCFHSPKALREGVSS